MKDRKKLFRRVMGLVLALALLVPLTGPGVVTDSFAATQNKINSLKKDANSLASQRKDLQNQIKALQADKSDAMSQKELLEKQINVIRQEIGNIDQQITAYDQQIAVYDQQIAIYDELIAQKEEELAQTQAEEEAQFDLFCRRMRAMEEQGETSYWAILFSSSSFSDLLDNYMMIEEIIQYDNKVIDDLAALQERVAADKAALEEAQAEQEEAKAEKEEAKAEQEEARRQQQAAQNDLKAQEAEVDKLIGEISAQESALKAQEDELRKAANSVDAEIKRLEKEMASQIQNVVSESGFRWPLPAGNNVITSYYGNRPDPFTKTIRNHTGVDISAGKGTSIYAAKSGVVTTSVLGSGANWAYGEYVVISHSDGTTTLYGHMNSRNVKKGQTVKQGDVIGYVGTTGRSTGYHLHFEVRVNGNRTDPLKYFKDKSPLYYSGKGGRIKIQ